MLGEPFEGPAALDDEKALVRARISPTGTTSGLELRNEDAQVASDWKQTKRGEEKRAVGRLGQTNCSRRTSLPIAACCVLVLVAGEGLGPGEQ